MSPHAPIRKPKQVSDNRAYHFKAAPRAVSQTVHAAWRQRISTTKLIDRLQSFALDDPDSPKSIRMTRTQAMVSLNLLRKVLPDMQSIEISGNTDNPITIQVIRFSDELTNDSANAGSGSALIADAPGKPLIDVTPDANPLNLLESFPHADRLVEDEPVKRRSKLHDRPIGSGAVPSLGGNLGRKKRPNPKV